MQDNVRMTPQYMTLREIHADHCDESENLWETAPEELESVLDSSSKEQGLKT